VFAEAVDDAAKEWRTELELITVFILFTPENREKREKNERRE
jgi:hypothetical protein